TDECHIPVVRFPWRTAPQETAVSQAMSQGLMGSAGVITITTRATARQRATTLPCRRAVAGGAALVVSRATYWRRRILVAVAAVALVLVMAQAGAALGGSLATPERSPASASPARTTARSTVVRPGDS